MKNLTDLVAELETAVVGSSKSLLTIKLLLLIAKSIYEDNHGSLSSEIDNVKLHIDNAIDAVKNVLK